VLIRAGSYPYGVLREGHIGRYDLDRDLWVDVFPVRLRDFGCFVAAGGYFSNDYWMNTPGEPPSGRLVSEGCADSLLDAIGYKEEIILSPVVGINWHEAMAYARWAGGILPSELEWAVAAWGTRAVDVGDTVATFGVPLDAIRSIPGRGRASRSHFISERGCYGMGVLVSEWCRDALSLSRYPAPAHEVDGTRIMKTVRGNPNLLAAFPASAIWDRAHHPCSDATREDPRDKRKELRDKLIGFRCVYEVSAWGDSHE
jgi:formylglycine-generating enzyme required for sulfatase activity